PSSSSGERMVCLTPITSARRPPPSPPRRSPDLFSVNGTRYFVKWSQQSPPAMFPAEADGLRRLGETGEIRVPAVIALGEADGACPAYLVLEWIETDGARSHDATMEDFGARLAAMHRHTASQHGLEIDNFI